MTGSCSLWLLLVTFHSLVCVAPVCCQYVLNVKEDYRLTFVLAIKNNKSGLQLELYQSLYDLEYSGHVVNSGASQWPDHELEPQIHFIPGHRLSPECGNQYFRCQELLIINESLFEQNDSREFITIVFVPLENDVLLLSFWHDSTNMALERSTFIVNSSDCSPTVFYNINSTFYMVCIRSYKYIAVYEIHLNLSSSVIEDATLTGPLTSISISSSPTHFSNIILVEHKVYFAVGNAIIVMDIYTTQTQLLQYPDTATECTQIYKLVPTVGAGNQVLLVAYCADRYAYFDPVYEDWTSGQLFSNSGVPYLCPDSNYKVRLLNSNEGGMLQFSVGDSSPNIIKNVNVSSGICFKPQNKTYFVYSDQQSNNVFVYDFTIQNHHPVSPYDCPHQDCPQLLLLENRYLVVRDDNHNFVLDVTTNFSLLLNISSGIADILAILHASILNYNFSTPSPPIIIHITTTAQNLITSTSINWSTTPILIHSLYHHTSATSIPQIIVHSTGSTTAQTVSTGINWVTTATPISSLDCTSTITPSSPIIIHSSTSTQDLVPSDINWGTVITPSPRIALNSTIMATVSPGTDDTRSSIYYTISRNNIETTTPTDNPIVVHSNTVWITLTVVGLFFIIIVLVMIAVGFSVRHLKRKW